MLWVNITIAGTLDSHCITDRCESHRYNIITITVITNIQHKYVFIQHTDISNLIHYRMQRCHHQN